MAIFKDPTGRRGRAVKCTLAATSLGGATLLALFAFSLVAPARADPPVARAHAFPPQTVTADANREASWRQQAAELRAAIDAAERARRRRPAADPGSPILAAFVVNWDPGSLRSLATNADRLTHVMPEWIRVAAGGELQLNEDARVLPLVTHLEVTPTVSNFGDGRFRRELALPLIATPEARAGAAHRLRQLCEERGYAGVNLDLEALEARDHDDLAAFVDAVWSELHPRGLLLSVDIPLDARDVPLARLTASTDFLVAMAYDLHAAGDHPGPIATPGWVSNGVARLLETVPAEKLVVAVGAYGYDWTVGAREPARELAFDAALGLARENEVPIEWDRGSQSPTFEYDDDSTGRKHRVWFQDAPAAAAQLAPLAALGLRGTAVWRLGAEDPALFDLFARSPAPRAFDAAGAPPRLSGSIAHDPTDVSLIGDGELFALRSTPHAGRREVAWDASGIAGVTYTVLPSGYVFERRGPKRSGRVALTFDDGPDPTWTPRILDVLRHRRVKATFFVVGDNVQAHPHVVKRLLDEGHLIGNHTFAHPDLARSSALRTQLEINTTARLIEWIGNVRPALFRPPYHSDDALDEPGAAEAVARAAALGYRTLGHDVDPRDFSDHDPRAIADRIVAQARSGSVVLLHDGGGDRSATVAALPLALDGLAAAGIEVVGVDELLGIPRDELLVPMASAETPALAAGDAVVFGGALAVRRAAVAAFSAVLALLALRAALLCVLAPIQARRRRAARGAPATVSVVVPAYNEEKVVAQTVRSLLEQRPPALEVLVIDDGSTDGTLHALLSEFGEHGRVRVFGKPNGGKASALNMGFAHARGEIVVALDGDTVFAPDTVAALAAPFADPRVAAVAGNAKVGNPVNRLTRWQSLEYITAQNLERRAWDLAGAVPVVPGAVGAWRRDVVLAAGGFHHDTLAEDTDLTLRLLAAGHRVAYADRAVAFTEAPESARSLLKQRFRWTFGVLQACWKHRGLLFRKGSGPLGYAVLPAFAVYQFAVPLLAPAIDVLLVAALVRGQASATAASYAAFFAVDAAMSALALRLERERLSLLWELPLQRIAHRYLLWLALVRSLWAAAAGFAVGWGKLARTGTVQAALAPVRSLRK